MVPPERPANTRSEWGPQRFQHAYKPGSEDHNSTRSSLSEDTFVITFSQRSDHQLSQRHEPHWKNVQSMSYLTMLENPSKNSWICIQMQDPNSRCGCLPKLHQFFLVHRHICGKIFMKPSSSFYVKLPTNKQKDKNRGHASQNLGQYSRTAFSKGPIFKTRSKSIRQLKEKYKLAASPDWILNLDEF